MDKFFNLPSLEWGHKHDRKPCNLDDFVIIGDEKAKARLEKKLAKERAARHHEDPEDWGHVDPFFDWLSIQCKGDGDWAHTCKIVRERYLFYKNGGDR